MPRREGAERESDTDIIHELALKGANYVRLKNDEKKLKKELDKGNKDLKETVKNNPEVFDVNGNHKEVYAPLGDGMNEVFIQLQGRESISMVDNVVDLVKQKLGKKASNFIMSVEVLHKDALQAMLNQGMITDEDILDWTVTKQTESLIVKVNKIRK